MSADALNDFPADGYVVSNQRWRSGLPLGGIGCGKLELLTDGSLGHYSGNHNWDRPTGWLRGGFFALKVGDATTLLRLARSDDYDEGLSHAEQVESNFLFPRGWVHWGGLPVDVQLEAFSPLIPHNVLDSALPTALFEFTLSSNTDQTVELLVSWPNLLGFGGRRYQTGDDQSWNRHDPVEIGEWSGLCFSTAATSKPLTTVGQHYVLSDGPVTTPTHWDEEAGLIARTIKLKAGEPTHVRFALVWHMPHHATEALRIKKDPESLEVADARAVLADDATRFCTDAPTHPGEALVLDLANAVTVDRLVVDNTWWQGDFTAGFDLQASDDGASWRPVAHEREAVRTGVATFTFAPLTTRFLRVVQTLHGPDWMWRVRRAQAFNNQQQLPIEAAVGLIHPQETETQYDDLGHYYSAAFETGDELAEYVCEEFDRLRDETCGWHDLIRQSSLPPWLQTLLLNHTFPAYTDTILTRDGRFSVIESPVHMYGSLGTMDQRQAAHAFWTMMFPALDRAELELYALCQDRVEPVADGRIPHFCGNLHEAVGDPMVDYGSPDWPDLSCSWIMQVCKQWRWTGDDAFLQRMWPHVERALAWLQRADTDGDGIPEGGSTYDYEHLPRGAFVFTASVYLGALRAASTMAEAVGAPNPYADRFDFVQQQTLDLLYDRDRQALIKWRSGEQNVPNTFVAALAGDWFVRLMGLDPIFPADVNESTLRTLLGGHLKSYAPIPPMEVTPEGDCFTKLCFVLQHQPYLGCEAIYQGYVDDGLEVHRRIYEAAWELNRSPWDTSLNLEAPYGKQSWLIAYMTCTATWHVLPALAGMTIDLPHAALHYAPQTSYHGPMFFPTFTVWIDCEPGEAKVSVLSVVEDGVLRSVNGEACELAIEVGAEWDLSRFAKWDVKPSVEPLFPDAQAERQIKPWQLRSSDDAGYDVPPIAWNGAIDDQPNTCWWTFSPMRPGAWLEIDFGQTQKLSGLRIDHRQEPRERPRGLRVETRDPDGFWRPEAELTDSQVRHAIEVDAGWLNIPFVAETQHLRLVQLGRHFDRRWSIFGMELI